MSNFQISSFLFISVLFCQDLAAQTVPEVTNKRPAELSATAEKSKNPSDWFDFKPFPELWKYIRAHSKQFELTRHIENNRIRSLSVFCTKEDSPSVLGFWVETSKENRECYVFAESQIQRMLYGTFLDKMGFVDEEKAGSIEKISLDQFESELKLRANKLEARPVLSTADAAKEILRQKNLAEIKKFVTANNSVTQPEKTDTDVLKELFSPSK